MCLVPNRLLVSGLVTKLFVKGLAIKLKGTDDSEVKRTDPAEIQMFNLLNSLPTATQTEEAYRTKRIVWTAQHERELNRVRVNLNFAFRVRCQFRCYVLDKPFKTDRADHKGRLGASPGNKSPRGGQVKWVQAYVAVVNGQVLAWPGLDVAASNKKPTNSFTIAGPAVALEPDDNPLLPPAKSDTKILSIASKSDRNKKIRDFYLLVKVDVVDNFEAAVYEELVATDSHGQTAHKLTKTLSRVTRRMASHL